MRIIKSILKSILFFILGSLASSLISMTALSYFAVDHFYKAALENKMQSRATKPEITDMAKANEEIPTQFNVKEIASIGLRYLEELNTFDSLSAAAENKSNPELCTTLCNAIDIDQDKLIEERSAYLVTYYKNQPAQAFLDPLFRLKIEEMKFLSSLFPRSIRSPLNQIKDGAEQNPPYFFKKNEKLGFALKLEVATLKEVTAIYLRKNEIDTQNKRLQALRDLIQSCQKGTPPQQVQADCKQQINP